MKNWVRFSKVRRKLSGVKEREKIIKEICQMCGQIRDEHFLLFNYLDNVLMTPACFGIDNTMRLLGDHELFVLRDLYRKILDEKNKKKDLADLRREVRQKAKMLGYSNDELLSCLFRNFKLSYQLNLKQALCELNKKQLNQLLTIWQPQVNEVMQRVGRRISETMENVLKDENGDDGAKPIVH